MSGITRDHGGDLERAMARFGGTGADWIDLSTGINRQPWPLPDLPARLWRDLPRAGDLAALRAAAARAYGCAEDQVLPLAGAQAAIQVYPRLSTPGRALVLGPTYNEHAASLAAQGWQVEEVREVEALSGADLALIVNPNNPDGRHHDPVLLRDLADRVGRLVVDESFADPVPQLSLAAEAGHRGLIVLRSFGKFWGLAGLRLGFLLGDAGEVARAGALAGPWAVSGPALAVGAAALTDRAWASATVARLADEAVRMDALAAGLGWRLVGGTHLFRTYETADAGAAQERLAQARIWSRRFPWSQGWLRLGLPGSADEWTRLGAAMAS